MDGEVVDAVAVLVDLALVAQAVGEDGVVQECGALEVFDKEVYILRGRGPGLRTWRQPRSSQGIDVMTWPEGSLDKDHAAHGC